MDPFLEKEYHPVIETFISEYVDDEMDRVEKIAFEELMVHDDDIRDLTFNAIGGKKLLEELRKLKNTASLIRRLNDSFTD
ncbi:MAG: hypothetical protein WD016_05430 [Balneolaceae bacterium]